MNKFLLFLSSSLFSCVVLAASNPWVTSLAIGSNYYDKKPNQTIFISDYIFDDLLHAKQNTKAFYSLGFQRAFSVQSTFLDSILLGPVVYYQQARFSGDVYELSDPEFYNYTYKLTANTFNTILESDIYFNSIKNTFYPYTTIGLGLATSQVKYIDFSLPGVTPETNLYLPPHTNNRLAGIVGAGLAIRLTQQVNLSFGYLYSYSAKIYSSLSTQNNLLNPIALSLNNQAILIGLHFT